jgi:hypothetical protein
MRYCYQLIQEYGILDGAQLYTLLKNVGQRDKKERNYIINGLYVRNLARRLPLYDRSYYVKSPGITPTGKHKAQIICFWLLLDYIHKVDNHHAAGTYSRISMEIDGRGYDIVYVKKGEERLCNANMRTSGDVRYFVVVEDVSQIPLIKGDKVHTFATVSEQGKVEYYSHGGQGVG